MKKNTLLKGILTLSILSGCSSKTPSVTSTVSVYSNTALEEVFDTMYSYQEYTSDGDAGKKHFDDSLAVLKEYNQLYDIYNDYEGVNNLKTINDNAGIKPVKVDQRIIDMLKMAKKFNEYSEGEFDITIGSLLKVWHEYREAGMDLNNEGKLAPVPTEEELADAAQYSGWDKVVIDEEASTVYITDSHVSLDVGGIAKGYAAEQAALAMQEDGMENGFLNVGRNIRLVGNKPNGDAWTVGISDPEGAMPSGIVSIRSADPVSVVTSGDYERFFVGEDGKSYPHIIDPSTNYPADLYRSVSILTPDSGAADCLSTTLFTLSVEEGKKVLANYTADTGNKADAVWIMSPDKTQSDKGETVGDYVIEYTDGLKDVITWSN